MKDVDLYRSPIRETLDACTYFYNDADTLIEFAVIHGEVFRVSTTDCQSLDCAMKEVGIVTGASDNTDSKGRDFRGRISCRFKDAYQLGETPKGVNGNSVMH